MVVRREPRLLGHAQSRWTLAAIAQTCDWLRVSTAGSLSRILELPTYASWLNPIEKLWRWLQQDVLHLHRLCDDWQALKLAFANFLDGLTDGSLELLRYVGLLPN